MPIRRLREGGYWLLMIDYGALERCRCAIEPPMLITPLRDYVIIIIIIAIAAMMMPAASSWRYASAMLRATFTRAKSYRARWFS